MSNKIRDCSFKKCRRIATTCFEGVWLNEDGSYDEDEEQLWDVCLGHYKYLMMESGKY